MGTTFVKRERQAVLQIGQLTWNRWSLGRLGCPHPMAAANLHRVIQTLKIASLEDLAARIHEIGTYEGCGVTAYWTCLAILREQGYDVEKVHAADVSYAALKKHALAEHPPTRKRRRAKR